MPSRIADKTLKRLPTVRDVVQRYGCVSVPLVARELNLTKTKAEVALRHLINMRTVRKYMYGRLAVYCRSGREPTPDHILALIAKETGRHVKFADVAKFLCMYLSGARGRVASIRVQTVLRALDIRNIPLYNSTLQHMLTQILNGATVGVDVSDKKTVIYVDTERAREVLKRYCVTCAFENEQKE